MALPSYTPPNATPIWAQANQQAQSIYQPILDQINAAYDRERQAAIARQQQLAQATDAAYQSARDPMEKLWSGAIEQGTTLENAVSNRLKGVGESRTADFASRLAQINAPTGAGDLAKTYQGADASGFARGMNDVSRLIGRKAESRSWLEKQPGLARQQSGRDLQEALSEMYGKYQDNRGEVLAGIPGQTQGIFDKLFGQAEGQNETKLANAWKKVEYLEEQKQAAMEARVVAAQLGDKAAARAATAREKALDRELQAWKAQLQSDTDYGTDNPPPKASGPTMKFNPDGTPNPNYNPNAKPGGGRGSDPKVQQRLREQQANTAIKGTFFNEKTGQPRTSLNLGNKSNTWIVQQINSALRLNKIDPTGPNGIRIRKAWLTKLGIKSGPNGNPAYPKKR